MPCCVLVVVSANIIIAERVFVFGIPYSEVGLTLSPPFPSPCKRSSTGMTVLPCGIGVGVGTRRLGVGEGGTGVGVLVGKTVGVGVFVGITVGCIEGVMVGRTVCVGTAVGRGVTEGIAEAAH